MWDDEFLEQSRSEFNKECIAMAISITLGLTCSGYVLSKLDNSEQEKKYEIIVNDENVIVISGSNIVSSEKVNDQCIIKLSNGTEFEVPVGHVYSIKDAKNEEDIKDYIYSVVGDDANISYYNGKDIKKKVKTR